ncbi:MAG TPA: response regulator [Candidatus Binatus sp.]|jgi:CheY-like chemotaxis protein|nr:response regulator [Candidatus Binatus sp.]
MSDSNNSNIHDANSVDNISSSLAAEIERGLREAANAAKAGDATGFDSEGRMLDAMCDAVIAGRPNTDAALAAANAAGPLASLLHSIQAEVRATVKPDARQEDAKLLEEIEKVAEACVTEYSLHDLAQSCGDCTELVVEESGAISSECATIPTAVLETAQVEKTVQSSVQETKPPNGQTGLDRRRRRRALISSPVRVRGVNITNGGPDEVTTTVDVSRLGLLFVTSLGCYSRGMDVMVTFPYSKAVNAIPAEQPGRVVRVHEGSDGQRRVAIALGGGVGEDLVDSCGRKLADAAINVPTPTATPDTKRPLVLAVDADATLRDSLKVYFKNEGYEVIAVGTSAEARDVLDIFTPALVIAEVEGEGLPGFDICAHVKSSSRLRNIPVVLVTRSAYPSDYSTAHSVGAVVCMAKPFKQERLGHVVRLLAPLPVHLQPKFIPRPGDPTRRPGCEANGNGRKKVLGVSNGIGKRFKFPSFR